MYIYSARFLVIFKIQIKIKKESKRLSLSKTTIALIDRQEVYGGDRWSNGMGSCIDCPQPFTGHSCILQDC